MIEFSYIALKYPKRLRHRIHILMENTQHCRIAEKTDIRWGLEILYSVVLTKHALILVLRT